MSRLKEFASGMPLWQKIILGVVLIGLVVGVAMMARPSSYEVLYSNLTTQDAGSVKLALSEKGIPFQMEDSDKVVKVKPEDVPTALAVLSEKGLPSDGSVGYELFNQSNMLTSNFQQQVQYKYTTINEIQKKLVKSFPGFITEAHVTADMKVDETLWAEESKQGASASVTVETKGGKRLTEQQAQAIRTMVAGHIIDLKAEDVEVMDSNGNTYETGEEGVVGGQGYSKQLLAQRDTEQRIRQDLQRTLSKNFGDGNYTLDIKVRIDFDEVVRNIEKLDPGVLVSRTQREENTEKNGTGTETETGTQANGTVPEYQQTEGTTGDQFRQTKTESIENYEIGKIVETIKQSPQITNVKVTATINKPLRRVEQAPFVQEWGQILANAAGIDVDENGKYVNGNVVVSVQDYGTINPVNLEEGTEEPKRSNDAFKYAAWAVGSFLTLFVLFLFFRPRTKKERKQSVGRTKASDSIESNGAIGRFGEMEQQSGVLMSGTNPTTENEPLDLESIRIEGTRRQEFENEVKRFAEEDPKKTAEYIKMQIKNN